MTRNDSALTANASLPPLSLYIHMPWCVRKCPYCDFNSHESSTEIPKDAYIQALIKDLQQDLKYVQGRKINSLFFGGGTPSLFSGDHYETLLRAIQLEVDFAPDIEITLEANPGTVERDLFSAYKAAGINRLSIGVQSFSDSQLKTLGRIHSAGNANEAINSAIKAGFTRINIDLMHGLPNQRPEQALLDLQQALDFSPEHLSWYQLTVEPNTVFYNTPPTLPNEDLLAEIQSQGQALLQKNNFKQYEVSAYSKAIDEDKESRLPPTQCQHNLNYWQFGDYLAIGAGAHGKISFPNGDIFRYQKTRQPKHYLDPKRIYSSQIEKIDAQDLPFEFMLNALRLNNGFNESLFQQRTGLPLDTIEQGLQRGQAQGLLIRDAQRIKASPKGLLFLNDLINLFLLSDQ